MARVGTAVVRAAWFSAALLGSTLMLAACGGGGSDTPSASTPQSENTQPNDTHPDNSTQQTVILKAADYRSAQVNDRRVYSTMENDGVEAYAYTFVNKEPKTIDGAESLLLESSLNGYTNKIGQHIDSLHHHRQERCVYRCDVWSDIPCADRLLWIGGSGKQRHFTL